MKRSEQAHDYFISGYNCSQAVFQAFAQEKGLDKDTAFMLTSGLGGGIGRSGETCGAVTGAIAALGLYFGNTDPQDNDAKDKMYAIAKKFMQAFTTKHNSLLCNDLIGYNLANPDEHKAAAANGAFRSICPQIVRDAAAIVDEMVKHE